MGSVGEAVNPQEARSRGLMVQPKFKMATRGQLQTILCVQKLFKIF